MEDVMQGFSDMDDDVDSTPKDKKKEESKEMEFRSPKPFIVQR